MRAHGADALHVLVEHRTTNLHLDGAEPSREVLVGLAQERVQREVQVDAAGIARHAGIEAAQRAPERRRLPAGAEVPKAMSTAEMASAWAPPRPP